MAASLRLKPASAKTAPPFLRFQTEELIIWVTQRSIKIRLEIELDSVNAKPLQVKWNWSIVNMLRIYIQIDGLFQSKLGILETGDLLRCSV
jgi:hypothetical protein